MFIIFSIQSLQPDPVLNLKRIVGFGGASYRDVSSFWLIKNLRFENYKKLIQLSLHFF